MADPVRRVLVANRGEIACRIIRTLDRMGVGSVAVYSDADAGAPHVRMAGAARRLGPPPAADSYLRADLLIAAALEHGADAVHPGYGFLSEDPGFAAAVEEAGLRFCGPSPDQIRAFGRKDAARALAPWGMGKRDLVSNVNWFMNVPVEDDGKLGIVDGISAPGLSVDLRAEVDTLVAISNCPQINNPCNGFDPTAVRLLIT